MDSLTWPTLNLAAFGLNTLVTYAVGTGGPIAKLIGAKSNSEISKEHRTLVTPAGWAFSIWGPIFLLEGIAVYRQWSGADAAWSPAASQAWCSACVLQGAWALSFGYEQLPLSCVLIFGITTSVAVAYANLAAPSSSPSSSASSVAAPLLDGRLGLGLHAAWLLAATIVNVNITAEAAGTSTSALVQMGRGSVSVALGASAALAWYFQVRRWCYMDLHVDCVA